MSGVKAIRSFPNNNKLLSGLPAHELARLLPHLETVELPRHEVLFKEDDPIKYAYFPTSGLISMLVASRNGDTLAIALVGSEGLIGVPLALRSTVMPYKVVVQIPGKALKINAEVFKQELQQAQEFEDRLLKYSNSRLNEMVQSLLCSRFHSLETRFCYALLVACDRIGSDTLVMTHEMISDMMGASRTSVTKVANDLRDAGLIRYRREKITVSNREGIGRLACECYKSDFESKYIAASA